MQAVMMTGTNKATCLFLLCEGKSTVGKHHQGGSCARGWWVQLPSSGMHERCIITLVPNIANALATMDTANTHRTPQFQSLFR